MGVPKACSTLGQGGFRAEHSLDSQKKLTFSMVQIKNIYVPYRSLHELNVLSLSKARDTV